jgi:hypothetical protein
VSSVVGAGARSQREPWEAMAGERPGCVHELAPEMEEEAERNRDSGVAEVRFADR